MSRKLHQPFALIEPREGAAVARVLASILDEQAVEAIRRQLRLLVGEPPVRGLRLNLEAVTAPTAGGLGGLLDLHHYLREAGFALVLASVGCKAAEVFRLTGLAGVLDVRPRGAVTP